MKMTPEQEAIAVELFGQVEIEKRLVVRFNVNTLQIHRGDAKRMSRHTVLREMTLLRFSTGLALTPTGGRYIRRLLTARTSDGQLWWGTMRKDSDVVRLRPAYLSEESATE